MDSREFVDWLAKSRRRNSEALMRALLGAEDEGHTHTFTPELTPMADFQVMAEQQRREWADVFVAGLSDEMVSLLFNAMIGAEGHSGPCRLPYNENGGWG